MQRPASARSTFHARVGGWGHRPASLCHYCSSTMEFYDIRNRNAIRFCARILALTGALFLRTVDDVLCPAGLTLCTIGRMK
jgi:hypothetical protein